MELLAHIILPVLLLAFALEMVDVILGMGYGTAMAPILLFMGYSPYEFVPALLLTNVLIGLAAGLFHHIFGNFSLSMYSRDLKVSLLLSAFGIGGVVLAVFTVFRIPEIYVDFYIGFLCILLGVIALVSHRQFLRFSYWKLVLFGMFGAFNKGVSGGGYGPVIVGGQLVSGVDSRTAVATASFSEGIVCVAGTVMYLIYEPAAIRWDLILSLLVGGLAGIPLATFIVSRIGKASLHLVIAVACILLGTLTLIRFL